MMGKTGKKLRSRSGETIGETLVALLISALALVMLAGAISATARMITASNAKMADYYSNDNNLASYPSGGERLSIQISGGGIADESYAVNGYKNDVFQNTPVVSYVSGD